MVIVESDGSLIYILVVTIGMKRRTSERERGKEGEENDRTERRNGFGKGRFV